MRSLPTTEVMGSTPGRHLEITEVTDGRKPQGKVLMHVIKKRAAVRQFNILPISVKNGEKKGRSHANEEFQANDINL